MWLREHVKNIRVNEIRIRTEWVYMLRGKKVASMWEVTEGLKGRATDRN